MAIAITIQADPDLDKLWDKWAAPYQQWLAQGVRQIETPSLYFPLARQTLATTPITDLPGSSRDGGRRIHAGIDLAVPTGTPVIAPFDAEIVEVNPHSRSGGILGLKGQYQGQKVLLRLVHLNRQSVRQWTEGQRVNAGQSIAQIDWENYNWGTGPHLHLETYIWRNGDWQLVMNPKPFWTEAHSASR